MREGCLSEYDEARCLFCYTGYEKEIAAKIDGIDGARAIIPTRIKRFKSNGVWMEEQKPLFNGYVFVYSEKDFDCSYLKRIYNVVRILRYNTGTRGILEGADALFAKTLWDLDGKIGVMKAVREGERVMITDGVFKALGGKVVAMDRRKMAARVELNVVGSTMCVWLSYEMIDVVGETERIELLPAQDSDGRAQP